jgi:hypothetical protein
MLEKPPIDFFDATDTFLDRSGKMSVCKDCINEAYERIFANEQSMEQTVLRLCRILNVRYDPAAIDAAKKHLTTFEEKGTESKSVFGIYKNKLLSVQVGSKLSEKNWDIDLTFSEPNKDILEELPSGSIDNQEYFEESWGKLLKEEDYEFLEQRYGRWTHGREPDSYEEEILLRELCHKENEIRKARLESRGVDNLVKSLQELMKNSALTPALQKAASSGKVMDTIGMKIKMIETEEPAEHYKDRNLFKDFFNIGKYFLNYVTRPIENFFSGNKNFEITEDNDIIMDDDKSTEE